MTESREKKLEREQSGGHLAGHSHVHTHVDEQGHMYMHEHAYQEGTKTGYLHEHTRGEEHGGQTEHVHQKAADRYPHEHMHGESPYDSEEYVHKHVHTQAEKRAVLNRLAKAIGHMEAIRRMVERDEDCSEVLIQLAAVRSAINNTGKLVLKNHINHCIMEAVEENDRQAIKMLDQAIDKFIK